MCNLRRLMSIFQQIGLDLILIWREIRVALSVYRTDGLVPKPHGNLAGFVRQRLVAEVSRAPTELG